MLERLDEAVGQLAAAPDITFKARYEDFVDVVGGRLDPKLAMATGRLRPRGSLRTLWSARGLFVA